MTPSHSHATKNKSPPWFDGFASHRMENTWWQTWKKNS